MSQSSQLHNSGITAFRSQKYEEAAHLLQQAYAAAQKEQNPQKAGEILNDLGVIQRELDELEAAEATLEEAYKIFSQLGDSKGQAQTTGNMANVFEAQQRYQEAVDAYKQSAKMFEAVGEGDLAMYAWQALSRLQLQQKNWLGAIASYEEGIEQMPEGSMKKGILQRIIQLPGKWLAGR
jgi:tetratricopeptide (TPR) repeat protein